MFSRLIRIYTPFICAIVAIIHGVLSLTGYEGRLYYILNEFTGHSIFVLLYIIATSRRMCKWYKITVCLLLSIHVLNLLYLFNLIGYYKVIYSGIVINILAFFSFIIYRFMAKITKFICQKHKY